MMVNPLHKILQKDILYFTHYSKIWTVFCENKTLIHYIDGFMQERRNSIANALELYLSCTNPSISCSDATILYPSNQHIKGLVQERRNSIANALEICLSCTNPSTSLWLSSCIYPVNPTPPGQNGHHFTDDMFKRIFWNEVSEWLNLTTFLWTADGEVHIVHISCLIKAYTLESLSSLT